MFFVLLALVVGMTYLGDLDFYPYAIFLSAILLLFLTAFLLFDKRITAGWHLCLILSSLFVFNQLLTLYFLFMQPSNILPVEVLNQLATDEAIFFPVIVSALLLFWGVFLFYATWKSAPVFTPKMREEQISWLITMRRTKPSKKEVHKLIAKAQKEKKVEDQAE